MFRALHLLSALFQLGWANLHRNRLTTWVSTTIIMTLLLLLAAWWYATQWVSGWLEPYRNTMIIHIYLDPIQVTSPITELENILRQENLVQSWRFISAKKSQQEFAKIFPELQEILSSLGKNPLPPSYEVRLNPEHYRPKALYNLAQKARSIRGVLSVEYQQWWVDRLTSLMKIIRFLGTGLGFILTLAALFTVANVIRLSFYARRDEIIILELLGTHPWLIRIPFYLEGLFLGVFGSIFALFAWILFLRFGEIYLNRLLADFIFNPLSFPFSSHLVELIFIAGVSLGLFGSVVALWMIKKES